MKAHLFRLSGQTGVYGLAGASLPLIGLITLPVFTHVFTDAAVRRTRDRRRRGRRGGRRDRPRPRPRGATSYHHYPASDTASRRAVIVTAAATSLASACTAAALVVGVRRPLADLLLGIATTRTLVDRVRRSRSPSGVLGATERAR